MSDVTVAPSASPPASNEVVVNQNPVSTPQPIGSQAPDKPVGDFEGSKHRPESRRESIQRAFDRAANAKPAEARMGHNNPPEPMEKERPKESLNLKKRPDQQSQRERGEHGHFAPRETGQTYVGT